MATGLSFNLCECSEINVAALEAAFLEYRANQSLEIDRLLGLGEDHRALSNVFLLTENLGNGAIHHK